MWNKKTDLINASDAIHSSPSLPPLIRPVLLLFRLLFLLFLYFLVLLLPGDFVGIFTVGDWEAEVWNTHQKDLPMDVTYSKWDRYLGKLPS